MDYQNQAMPVLTQAEALMLREIVVASQKYGYCWGNYGWWVKKAWDRTPEDPGWAHRKVNMRSMHTRTGAIIDNRNWRRRLQSLVDKNCLVCHYTSPTKRLMAITIFGQKEIETWWYPNFLAKCKRQKYSLPDIVVEDKPGYKAGQTPGQIDHPPQQLSGESQGTNNPGDQGTGQGTKNPGFKHNQKLDTIRNVQTPDFNPPQATVDHHTDRWSQIQFRLRPTMSESDFENLIKPLSVTIESSRLCIQAPTETHSRILSEHHLRRISEASSVHGLSPMIVTDKETQSELLSALSTFQNGHEALSNP